MTTCMKTCPNCGETVGIRAETCFNCKYNFKYRRIVKIGDDITAQDLVYAINSIFEPERTIYYPIQSCLNKNQLDEAILLIQNHFQCDHEMATNVLALYKEQLYDKLQRELKEAAAEARARGVGTPSNYVPNEPKCPTCGSTLVKRLSVVNRGASVAVWGVYSNKFNKSFECKNCGYTW